mmetsp:Transcript_17191/g.49110  ORF Transcript_17191/g.49110 Transcript_17191/m.49110 type:complete len:328 (-) Transcript_17191:357-1340(-)
MATLRVLVASLAFLHLCACFMKVDVQWRFQLLAQLAALGDRPIRARVRGVQRHGPRNSRLIGILLPGLLALGEVLVGATAIAGERELDRNDPDSGTNPGLNHRLADSLGEPVHVIESCGATLQHLSDCEVRTLLDELMVHKLELQGPDRALEPLAQRKIVGHPAQVDHGGVGVRVDEAGHQRRVRQLRRPLRLVLFDGVRGRQDVEDLPVRDHDGVVVQCPLGLHRDHPSGQDDLVGRHPRAGLLRTVLALLLGLLRLGVGRLLRAPGLRRRLGLGLALDGPRPDAVDADPFVRVLGVARVVHLERRRRSPLRSGDLDDGRPVVHAF